MNEILRLENVSYSYMTKSGETKAVKELNFAVKKGEFVAVIGPSGCGKTTVLSLIAGLIKPTGGKITLSGKEVLSPGGSVGYMLQRDELFNWLTIEKNALLPLEIKKAKTKESALYVNTLLDKYGLKDFKKKYPSELSGGMRQRAALIRTLSFKPDLLLLDEPFSALDYQTRLSVCDDVYSIIRKENKTAVLVTHDISEAISLADKIIVLSSRPATVAHTHEFNFDKSLTPILRRKDENFGKRFDLLWRELDDEKRADFAAKA
mgnify:FL=1